MKYIVQLKNVLTAKDAMNKLPNPILMSFKDVSTAVSAKSDSIDASNMIIDDGNGGIAIMDSNYLKKHLGYDDIDVEEAMTFMKRDNMRPTKAGFTIGKSIKDNWDSASTSINSKWRNNGEQVGFFFPKLDFDNVTDAQKAWHASSQCGLYYFPRTLDLPKCTSPAGIFWYDYHILPRVVNMPACTTTGTLFSGSDIPNDIELNLDSATNMDYMVYNSNIYNSNIVINAKNIVSTTLLFYKINFLENVTLTLNCPKMTSTYSMFEYTTGSCDFSNIVTSNINNISYMFYYSTMENVGDLSNWDVSNVTTFKSFLYRNTNIKSIGDLSNWDTSGSNTMQYMFRGCTLLESLGNLTNWNVSKVTNMQSMFSKCTSLKSIGNLANWNTSKVTNMQYMFSYCQSLESLDISGWDTSAVAAIDHMFTYQDGTDTGTSPNTTLTTLKLGSGYFNTSCTSFDFNLFEAWSHDSMIESLYTNQLSHDTSKVQSIQLHKDAFARLSETEIANITALGFTLTAFEG